MQVETPEVGAEKATTPKTVSLSMLQGRLSTVWRTREGEDVGLGCLINGHSFQLNNENFQVDDSGRLELTLPTYLSIENKKCDIPQRVENAFDNSLRTLHVVDMASVLGTEELDSASIEEPLQSFLDALNDQPIRHFSLQALADVLTAPGWSRGEDEDQREHEREVLVSNAYNADRAGLHGLGIQFGTPRREYMSASSYRDSWGLMKTVWVYADSFEEAYKLGVEWSLLEHEKERAQAGFALEANNV